MNKEQSADDPSVDLIRVKNASSASTTSMSYPDVVIACIWNISVFWKHSEQLRQR